MDSTPQPAPAASPPSETSAFSCFDDIPNELLQGIFRELEQLPDLLALSQVSHRFANSQRQVCSEKTRMIIHPTDSSTTANEKRFLSDSMEKCMAQPTTQSCLPKNVLHLKLNLSTISPADQRLPSCFFDCFPAINQLIILQPLLRDLHFVAYLLDHYPALNMVKLIMLEPTLNYDFDISRMLNDATKESLKHLTIYRRLPLTSFMSADVLLPSFPQLPNLEELYLRGIKIAPILEHLSGTVTRLELYETTHENFEACLSDIVSRRVVQSNVRHFTVRFTQEEEETLSAPLQRKLRRLFPNAETFNGALPMLEEPQPEPQLDIAEEMRMYARAGERLMFQLQR